MKKSAPETACPCGSKMNYSDCCGRQIDNNEQAATCAELARARFSAHARKDIAFLKKITHPDATDNDWDEYQHNLEQLKWVKFAITDMRETPEQAEIECQSYIRQNQYVHRIKELVTYRKTSGQWYFYDGEILEMKRICPCDCSHCLGCY